MTVREGDRAEGPFALVSVIGGTWVPVGLWYCVYVELGRCAELFFCTVRTRIFPTSYSLRKNRKVRQNILILIGKRNPFNKM